MHCKGYLSTECIINQKTTIMAENQNIEERIDRYLLRQMGPIERLEFEADLRNDSALKEEFEIQRTIFESVQRVGMRRAIQSVAEEHNSVSVFSRIKAFFSDGQGRVRTFSYAFAVAACVACVCVFSLRLNTAANFRTMGTECYVELSAPIARSSDEIADKISEVYDLIGADELDSAQTLIDATNALLTQDDQQFESAEQAEYYEALCQGYKEDLEWYQTIIYMKEGKVGRAKKVLKSIAKNGGTYSNEALSVLNRK